MGEGAPPSTQRKGLLGVVIHTILPFGFIRRLLIIVLVVALAIALWTAVTTLPGTMLSGTALAQTSSTSALSWTEKTSMPTARRDLGVAADSTGKIYAVGGYDGQGNFLSTLEMYDPTTDTWTEKTPMPAPRNNVGFTFFPSNGKFYVAGGFNGTANSSEVDEYDPTTDTWTQKAPLLQAHLAERLVVGSNEKIYAIDSTDNEEYDPTTDAWTEKTPMPTPRGLAGIVSAPNGKIYVIGGGAGNCNCESNIVEEYDPVTDTWIEKTPMPTPRSDLGVSINAEGKIYAIGGNVGDPRIDPPTPTNTVEEYDPTTDTWTTSTSLPIAVYAPGAALGNDNNVHVIGGQTTNSPAVNTHYVGSLPLYDFGNGSGGSFAPPISSSNLNQVKAGQSVPVKFGLGGDFGLDIFASGYPTSQSISCQTGQPTDTVPITTSSTSGLTYDSTSGQYIYTWKTDKAWSGTCRQLIIKLNDGSTHTVNFQFK